MCTARTVAAAVLPYHCAMVMTLPIAVDFRRFHSHDVASWLADGRGRAGAAQLGDGRSLTIRLVDGGGACTYRSDGRDLSIDSRRRRRRSRRRDGPIRVQRLRQRDVVGVRSALLEPGAHRAAARSSSSPRGSPRCRRCGSIGRSIRRPPSNRWSIARAGRSISRQSFTLADDRDEMAHFLRTTGYLVVRGVFATSEIDELNALIAAEKATARSGDNRSWWATGADGREVCCRLTYLGLARRSDSLGWPTIPGCVISWR